MYSLLRKIQVIKPEEPGFSSANQALQARMSIFENL